MRRRRRALGAVRAALALLAAGTLVHAGPASAQSTAPRIGGYQGIAQADGVHVFYNPEGLLPISAPVDFGAPDAYATIASGPATFARASAADPGDLLANPNAFLALGVPGYKSGTIPAYPYRISASSGSGAPHAELAPAPGLMTQVDANESGSVATSTMPGLAAPAIATAGSMSSTASTIFEVSTVTVHARSEISNLDVLGIVKIGSIVTDLTAISDGIITTLSGGTVVSDASVAGTPIVIDTGGVRAAPGSPSPTSPIGGLLGSITGPVLGNLNDLLANAGINISVADPVQQGSGAAGQLSSSGLRIDFEFSDRTFPTLRTLVDAVPYIAPLAPGAPSVGDIIELAKARHLVDLQIGRGMASLSARPARPVPALTPAAGRTSSTTGGTTSAAVTSSSGARIPASAPSLIAAAPSAVNIGGDAPAVPIGAGVGALALLALLGQPFIGDRLARASQVVLAADSFSTCPWEGR